VSVVERYSIVSLHVKILKLLAQEYKSQHGEETTRAEAVLIRIDSFGSGDRWRMD
jgi:hypothetical protein